MMTFARSPQSDLLPMELPLMSSAAGSPVKTSASPGKVPDSTANAPGFGASSTASSPKSGRATRSSKTSAPFGLADWTKCSGRSLRSGMTLSGTVYPLLPLAPLTAGTECGSWPTPHGFSQDGRSHGPSGNELGRAVNRSLWPMPTVPNGGRSPKGGMSATGMTPDGKKRQVDLRHMVNMVAKGMWPTPTTSDWKSGSKGTQGNSRPLSEEVGGSLNPTWVEWLMGFPLGWTALKPSATPSSRKSRKSSGGPSCEQKG